MFYKGLSVLIKALRELDLASEDVLVYPHRIVIIERVNSRIHFVDENTQCPPINRLSMPLVQNHFGRDVLWSSTNGEGSSFIQNLGEPKIS